MADVSLIDRLLDVIENDIVPKTARGVAQGNKLFGAAILRKADRSLVLAETNNEIGKPALARRGALPEALLRNAEGRARRHQATASSSPRTSPARSACRRSPGPASTISTICSATRIRATASPSRTI